VIHHTVFRQTKGFTLLELLVAVTIVSMLAIGIGAGLSAAVRAWESGERNLELYQTKRIVAERLRAEIGNAVNVRGQHEDREDMDRLQMIFHGESDSLSFLTSSHAISSPGLPMALKESHIHVEPGVGLVIREAMFSGTKYFDPSRGFVYVLDPNVTSIEFAYYYVPRRPRGEVEEEIEGEWLGYWGPEHVEILETIETEEGMDGQMIRMQQQEVTMRLPMAVEILITSIHERTGERVQWQPLTVPLKDSRVLGVSVLRRY
jgi:prepilin-type N-terminal cleavage/methylation domain-containing protein